MSDKTILVVEDSPYLAESVRDLLELHDYNVHVAKNGREGVAFALEHHPDFILLEIRLPDISGYEVFTTIKNDEWGKNAAISILTASESIEEISKNVNVPIEYVLFKPSQSLPDLLEHVRKRLGES